MGAATVRVGLAQSLVVPGDVEGNLARAAALVAQAAAAGCEAVVLPECFDVGWTDARAPELAEPIPGPRSERLAALAREHGILIAAGLTERDGDAVHNAAVLIDRDGTLLARHRKINELDFARGIYTTGTTLTVADSSLGRIGLNICADNYADSLELGRAQIRMGARILLSPSSWAVPPEHDDVANPYGANWEDPYRDLALGGGVPVVGVSNVGPVSTGEWAGWSCIGRSLALDRDGRVAARGSFGVEAEELLIAEVALGDAPSATLPQPPRPPAAR